MEGTLTVGAVIFDGDKVLLVKHKEGAAHITGTYGFPAGRVNDGEEIRDTLIREVKEETGFYVQPIRLINKVWFAEINRKSGKKEYFGLILYLCRIVSGELSEGDETKPEWVEISKLDELNFVEPHTKDVILRIYNSEL
ncbi:MAG: NUDIX domain-containing protein [Candidatus Parvarchaeota archaeon]|nr:NUDIX domain-containing protein [Candidatus Jingweiarchaeum tengchongense]MCW1298209.1 NUDIX domain-containing protein [Candidatus Jingweiarchaeum tengchongense]MCW1305003.1 NUDIX domain-containing protein [Candidatus Jingweiarchaeum tengchongense]